MNILSLFLYIWVRLKFSSSSESPDKRTFKNLYVLEFGWIGQFKEVNKNVKIKLKEVNLKRGTDTCFLIKDVELLGWASDLIFAFPSDLT